VRTQDGESILPKRLPARNNPAKKGIGEGTRRKSWRQISSTRLTEQRGEREKQNTGIKLSVKGTEKDGQKTWPLTALRERAEIVLSLGSDRRSREKKKPLLVKEKREKRESREGEEAPIQKNSVREEKGASRKSNRAHASYK